MNDVSFRQLELPEPNVHRRVRSASHAVQSRRTMGAFEPVVGREEPDLVHLEPDLIVDRIVRVLAEGGMFGQVPTLWDERAGHRIRGLRGGAGIVNRVGQT